MARTETIFQAITTAYWESPEPYRMANAAAKAVHRSDADLKDLVAIIDKHLNPVDFVRMAEQLANALSGFTVNGILFDVDQVGGGELEGKWVWIDMTNTEEGKPFDTAWECQQDAIRYVREMEAEEREQAQHEADVRRFGSYEQQVANEWKSSRL